MCQAAKKLLELGARWEVRMAAGAGRLDLVRSCFEDDGKGKLKAGAGGDGKLLPVATPSDLVNAAFAFACMNGHLDVRGWLAQPGKLSIERFVSV